MRARRLCRMALRFWMGLVLILGMSSHFYSPTRRRLVHSRLLQIYNWLMMVANFILFYTYQQYAVDYFVAGTFKRQTFVAMVCDQSVNLQLVTLVIQTLLRVLRERQVCQVYNELSGILERDLKLEEHSRLYHVVFLAKIHNFVHNFNFALSVLIIWGMRTFGMPDFLANLYFVYNSLARDAVQVAYILLLLDLSEALRLNGQRVSSSYGHLMEQLRRQERLIELVRRVHRMFAWLVAVTLFYELYFNTATIYLGYAFVNQRHSKSGLHILTVKVLLTGICFLVKLSDALLLQIVCEHLLGEQNQVCASPKFQGHNADAKAAHRQWEMSLLRRAIRRASPENKVLGMFRMDMRRAFALISCSLSYGIIIIQIGYVHS
ncbi:putative gustatory receptor 10b [Drosophila rhopaloa]|uniref:Gustatory receptor n=1 Tax=Drosophila rhopaloa TaxID=1041015 RepID=A0A6P4F8Z9_DRORH|nr:putative gustatory receptor 10b [Drosophila rhopaloa]